MKQFEGVRGREAVDRVHFQLLHDLYWYGSHDEKNRILLLQFWNELYPRENPYNPFLSASVSTDHQIGIIGALRPFHDPCMRDSMVSGALRLMNRPLTRNQADTLLKALHGIPSQQLDAAAREMRLRDD